jgi:hypothetical protein
MLLAMIPGYSFLKGVTEGLRAGEEQSRDFIPVIAKFDDNAQIAFEIERTADGNVVIFLPGCPDPWSGSVVLMTDKQVTPLQLTVNEAVRNIRTLGRGTASYAAEGRLGSLR